MGVILFTLVCGRLPFNGKNFKEISKAIVACNPRIPIEEGISLSYEITHLLDKMITYPDERISMKLIKEHPWCLG